MRTTNTFKYRGVAILALVAVSAIANTAPAASWGDLTGTFVYDGTPPKPKALVITADVKAFGMLGLVDESLMVDPKTRRVANVVVYVRTREVDVHPDYAKNVKKELRFDNKGGRFAPHILPVWLDKQQVLLCNSDSVPHSSKFAPFGDKELSKLIPPAGSVDHKFAVPQIIPVPVSCAIHPWMKGYVLPRNNPYVAVTAADGSFKLEKLPAGVELEFQVWHEKSGYVAIDGWPRGRFKIKLRSGVNRLGTNKIPAKLFEK